MSSRGDILRRLLAAHDRKRIRRSLAYYAADASARDEILRRLCRPMTARQRLAKWWRWWRNRWRQPR